MLTTNPQLTRRLFFGGGLAVTAGSIAWSQINRLPFDGDAIDPATAHKLALAGEITLLDIRRPGEWARTGSGEGAHRLDLRKKDFIEILDGLLAGDRTKPVALICATGVRSNRMSEKLVKAGFTNIIDVPEGMLGSRAGPGWIKRGLPLYKS
ncbi:MAG: rhodanese-like domain-containing protein [Proteobacteria bacterium]|nr:rhodanese-like domain-containing protein [Pseudomonadota bacterium]